MTTGEKGNMPSLSESELLLRADLREAFPELREYAEKIREAFRAKGVELDDNFNLKSSAITQLTKGVTKSYIPEVCHDCCFAYSGKGNCGTGCTECAGPCVACTSWANEIGDCGMGCTECVSNV